MSLIKYHYRFLCQLFRHQISYLGVQQVVVAVHHNVGMQDLREIKRKQASRYNIKLWIIQ